MKQLDTVIFDMDGTMLDTLEDLADAVNHALSKSGYPLRTLEEIREFVGNGVYALMERALPQGISRDEVLKNLEAFKAYYEVHSQDKTKPYDGIKELLAQLKGAGIKTAILSNKYDGAVKALAEEYFPGYIDLPAGEQEGIPKKPQPEGIYAIIEKLGSSKEMTLYVGDSEVDAMTAKNAGLPFVGVTWGFRDVEVLRSHGADFIINRPDELWNVIGR